MFEYMPVKIRIRELRIGEEHLRLRASLERLFHVSHDAHDLYPREIGRRHRAELNALAQCVAVGKVLPGHRLVDHGDEGAPVRSDPESMRPRRSGTPQRRRYSGVPARSQP